MKIATWNVNGIRARHAQVQEWIARERPDVVCLQEIKASPEQLPWFICDLEGYWCYWHGDKGYSGVALLVSRERWSERPRFVHPAFDFESRIVTADLGDATVASIYVPNGNKDLPGKMAFLSALDDYAAGFAAAGKPLILCGDLNVARTEIDVHPKERKPGRIGQLPEERLALERIIGRDLVDLGRAFEPGNEGLFTWWPPWREMRQRNIGWRLDYVLASGALAKQASQCVVQPEVGTSDHAPVIAVMA